MHKLLVIPMVFYVFYMFALAALLFRTRVRAIKSGEIRMRYFKSYSGETPSERTLTVGRHFDNQFQLPMLFFAACIAHIAMGTANSVTLILAWLFIFARLLHSWIHLGGNSVMRRAFVFGIGWLFVLMMWGQLAHFASQTV